MAATKACGSILCCDDTLELLCATGQQGGTVQSTLNQKPNTIVFTWLSQLLENANVEMKMFDYCKCTLPNEIYMLALGICIQLLELNVINKSNQSNKMFDWIIQKCFTASQEIADLCFIALANVYISFDKELCNSSKYQANATHYPDSLYLGPIMALTLLNIGSTRLNIHETAISLLRVVNKRYLNKATVVFSFECTTSLF